MGARLVHHDNPCLRERRRANAWRRVCDGVNRSERSGTHVGAPTGTIPASTELLTAQPETNEAHVAIQYRSKDGREWWVTLEAPGKVLSVSPDLEKSGALLPEHQIRIVFTSGDQQFSEEYTEFAALEDLSEGDLNEWFEAAQKGEGL